MQTGTILFFFFFFFWVRAKCDTAFSFIFKNDEHSLQPPKPSQPHLSTHAPELLPLFGAVMRVLTKVGFLTGLPPVNAASLYLNVFLSACPEELLLQQHGRDLTGTTFLFTDTAV